MGEADVVHHLIESIYAAEVLHVDVMYNFPLSLCTSRLWTTSGFGPRVDKPDHLVLRSHHLDEMAIINIFESYVGRAQLHDLHSDDYILSAGSVQRDENQNIPNKAPPTRWWSSGWNRRPS